MTERGELVHRIINELRELRDHPYKPTPDIDMVWVLSAPGTINEHSDDGIYNGESADRVNIMAGINLVYQITAIRLGKEVKDVTKEDVAANGPIFFYNGEDETTTNVKYRQNEALARVLEEPSFPLPKSKVVIDHIDTIGTPAQVRGIAKYFEETNFEGMVAVISMIHHSRRVSRYLNHQKGLFASGVKFVNAFVPETVNGLGKSLREVRKVVKYSRKGDLTEEPLEGF